MNQIDIDIVARLKLAVDGEVDGEARRGLEGLSVLAVYEALDRVREDIGFDYPCSSGVEVLSIETSVAPPQVSAPGFRWSDVDWLPMPPPENTWVMLKQEGIGGEEIMSSGYVKGGRCWGVVVYDGAKDPDSADHTPLSMSLGWAPIFTPAKRNSDLKQSS